MMNSEIPNGTHPELFSVDGGQGPTTSLRLAGSEANLDFQMAYGLIWPQDTVLYQVDDEWYQSIYQTDPAAYTGFFNSKAATPLIPIPATHIPPSPTNNSC